MFRKRLAFMISEQRRHSIYIYINLYMTFKDVRGKLTKHDEIYKNKKYFLLILSF